MNITSKNFSPVATFFDELMNRNIGELIGGDQLKHIPSANIIERDTEFIVSLAAPGFDKSDFNILLEKHILTIKVERETSTEGHTDISPIYNRREFSFGNFSRSFKLPKTADSEHISASYTNGLLNLTILKKKEAQPGPAKTIEIS